MPNPKLKPLALLAALPALLFLLGACALLPVPTPTPVLPTATATRTPTLRPADTAMPLTGTPFELPRILREDIPAPALTGNLLGDPAERSLLVYLPPSYYTSRKRFPVVYYLPDYADRSMPGTTIPLGVDKDIDNGYFKELIIVVVSGVNSLGGSFYVNSPVTGNWDDFVTQDVVSYVDANYRTLAAPASRAIGGHGMGGFGALNLAMLHPGVFGVVYSLSPDLFDPHGLAESPMFSTPGNIQDFVDFETREALIPADQVLTDIKNTAADLRFALAYGAAFAPNPHASPLPLDYPYQRQGGQLVRDPLVWGRWEAGFGNLAGKIQAYRSNLLRLNGIIVDYGALDEIRWIPKGSEYFSAQLNAAGIQTQLVVFNGDHTSNLEQRIREFMLPYFSEKLVFDE